MVCLQERDEVAEALSELTVLRRQRAVETRPQTLVRLLLLLLLLVLRVLLLLRQSKRSGLVSSTEA